EAKARLAEEIAARFHGREAARAAREGFDRQFRDRELPESIPELYYPGEWPARGVPLAVVLREVALAASSSDARRPPGPDRPPPRRARLSGSSRVVVKLPFSRREPRAAGRGSGGGLTARA
ncbi:MAG TPA: hypothetical protein VMS76_18465, partial [Planctomycetota bacterium]|nr:hypothetical protein [Planctomycetota bacterium]